MRMKSPLAQDSISSEAHNHDEQGAHQHEHVHGDEHHHEHEHEHRHAHMIEESHPHHQHAHQRSMADIAGLIEASPLSSGSRPPAWPFFINWPLRKAKSMQKDQKTCIFMKLGRLIRSWISSGRPLAWRSWGLNGCMLLLYL